jgi:hypothetical protein
MARNGIVKPPPPPTEADLLAEVAAFLKFDAAPVDRAGGEFTVNDLVVQTGKHRATIEQALRRRKQQGLVTSRLAYNPETRRSVTAWRVAKTNDTH